MGIPRFLDPRGVGGGVSRDLGRGFARRRPWRLRPLTREARRGGEIAGEDAEASEALQHLQHVDEGSKALAAVVVVGDGVQHQLTHPLHLLLTCWGEEREVVVTRSKKKRKRRKWEGGWGGGGRGGERRMRKRRISNDLLAYRGCISKHAYSKESMSE